MTAKITNFILIFIILVVLALTGYFYPDLPSKIAVHWNELGVVDGYAGKFWGTFWFPIAMAGIFLLYLVIPKIDPLGKNFAKFSRQYNIFWVAFMMFFAYIFALQLMWNLGYKFDFSRAIVVAVAILWYIIGFAIQNSKRNWFFGIRTPWTISSDKVWEKTHQFGGKLFKLSSLLIFVFVIFFSSNWLISVFIISIILCSLLTVVYSYLVFTKISK